MVQDKGKNANDEKQKTPQSYVFGTYVIKINAVTF